MAGKEGVGIPRPAAVLVAVLAGWTAFVIFYISGVPAGQRPLLGGSLFGVGCLLAGMGYLSMLRRQAMRQRQQSLAAILEKRRRERRP